MYLSPQGQLLNTAFCLCECIFASVSDGSDHLQGHLKRKKKKFFFFKRRNAGDRMLWWRKTSTAEKNNSPRIGAATFPPPLPLSLLLYPSPLGFPSLFRDRMLKRGLIRFPC
ncbi:uncharacterized protein EURHEDRAFT_192016 [Aspergillus ruber CBS 135680]|uniref:Uncharacterized protein n=1 Tax=Aspergillus ruber (strain CBS 135680) TaxID=1388766 RepID=A0A017S696_ASPRC|nr:uncharacterized protein EURHEDRAFT_192016 [Aspergillus ruber CBS 135680]EYE92381.1 hypothetical protein EURHEDRAFT_192016 [Aspergillus ruber CBS 135680]